MRALFASLALGLPVAALCTAAGYRALRARARRPAAYASLPADVRVVLFDLDHTLARYELPALYRLVHDCCARFLVHERGYDASLLAPYDAAWPALKGLILDLETGDLLLLDASGTVARARHGAHAGGALDAHAVDARYGGEGRRWREADALKRGAHRGESYFALCTGFDLCLSYLCAQLVDLADARALVERRPARYDFLADVAAAINNGFRQPAFAEGTGSFFSALRASPARYVAPRPHVGEWLSRLRANGVLVCCVTNSHADYARWTMGAAFGAGAAGACDLIVSNACKPSFFASDAPLRTVIWTRLAETGLEQSADGEPLGAHPRLPHGEWLAGGSAAAFEALTGCAGGQILFVGDSCHGEVVPAHRRGWRTLAVVEELHGGSFYEPLEWGGSFWSAARAGSEPFPATTATPRPQSWLGSEFREHAHSIVADVATLATGAGISWQPHGGKRWL